MKILIVGLGSMGKRRARLLKGLRPELIICGVDSTESRRAEAETLGIKAYASIAEACIAEAPNAALVCTAPITHANIITELLNANLPVFTELNLINDGYEKNLALAAEKKLPMFLSSTMLYRKETQYIKNEVQSFNAKTGKNVNYIYHIGQYLPDWHPWENYKNFFVGDKRTGGVREIFGIELPWLVDAFGDVVSVHAEKDKISKLEVEYPDSYFVTVRHANGTKGILAVDIVSPKAVRNFECFGEGIHLFWEGNPKSLYKFDKQSGEKLAVDTYNNVEQDSRYSDNIVENAYVDELSAFFDMLEKGEEPKWNFEKDAKVIELIEKIG